MIEADGIITQALKQDDQAGVLRPSNAAIIFFIKKI